MVVAPVGAVEFFLCDSGGWKVVGIKVAQCDGTSGVDRLCGGWYVVVKVNARLFGEARQKLRRPSSPPSRSVGCAFSASSHANAPWPASKRLH